MLRHTLNDMRPLAKQVLVALLGRIANKRYKLIHIVSLTAGRYLHHKLNEPRFAGQFIHHLGNIFLRQQVNYGGFNRFDSDKAWRAVYKAFERSKPLIFEKELHGFVIAVIVEERTHAAFFDKDIVLRY